MRDDDILLTPQGITGHKSDIFWQRFFPGCAPQEIYQILKRGMPPWEPYEKIVLYVDAAGFLTIQIDLFQQRIQHSDFCFKIGEGEAKLIAGYVFINQQKASATQMLVNMEDIYEMKEISTVRVASEEIGSYAWLKYGFVPDTVESFRPGVIKNLDQYEHFIPKEEREFVTRLLQSCSDDPKIAWAIADMDGMTNEPKPRKYGQLLMIDTNWTGSRDRYDADSMARFHSYCKGKLAEREI